LASGVWLPLSGYVGAMTTGDQVTPADTSAIQMQTFCLINLSLA